MKIKVNTEIIKKLSPCKDRFENWFEHYDAIGTIDILQFLELDKITFSDKLWVTLRLMPRELVEVFAIDCALSAQKYAADAAAYAADNAYAAEAADAAVYAAEAADAAVYAAVYAANAAAANAVYAAEAADAAVYAAVYAANAAAASYSAAVSYAAAKLASQNDSLDALAYLITKKAK